MRFLNAHQNEIICSSAVECNLDDSLCHDGMQYMKYALYTGNYDPLFRGVLTGSLVPDDGEVLVDFNAVSLNEFGHPETLLNYIDRELVAERQKAGPNRNYISSIESFRDMIADPDPDNGFFAKRFNELSKDVQKAHRERLGLE